MKFVNEKQKQQNRSQFFSKLYLSDKIKLHRKRLILMGFDIIWSKTFFIFLTNSIIFFKSIIWMDVKWTKKIQNFRQNFYKGDNQKVDKNTNSKYLSQILIIEI